MELDNERVQTIGKMYHGFFDEIVRLNINENEWDGFVDNKRKVYESIGLPIHTFQMDESGSRWLEYEETEKQDEDYFLCQKVLNNELEDLVIKWIVKHRERGWEHFMEFLNNKRQEFLNDIQTYYLFHGSSYGEEEPDPEGMDTILEEFESLQLPQVNLDEGDKDDDISVESILQSLREELEDDEDWVEDPPDEMFDDDDDENPTDGEPR